MPNSSFTIQEATTQDLPIIQLLSKSIWNQVYPSIISQEQIDFMLNMMYSTASLTCQMEVEKHKFLTLIYSGETVGFASYSPKDAGDRKRYRLHKLYVEPKLHGQGLGRSLVSHIIKLISSEGGQELELNVNKLNPAISFYKHIGFTIEKEVVLDIGNGYVMDDFIMVLDLAKNPA